MFTVRHCDKADLEEVAGLLRETYYPEEPLTRANNLLLEPALAAALLPQGHSFLALSGGRAVGVALNDQPPQAFPTIYTHTEEDIKFREMFAYMERESGVLEAAPGALEVRMLAVVEEWRGRGVATALLQATRQAAQEARCPWLKLYCTSHHSSRLMQKLGWRLLYSLDYSTYTNRHRGSGIALPPQPHDRCNLYIDRVSLNRYPELHPNSADRAVDNVPPLILSAPVCKTQRREIVT